MKYGYSYDKATKTKKISTPKGTVISVDGAQAKLTWNPGFSDKWNGQYSQAQSFVDKQVLRLSDPYIPFQTGMLKQSGTLGTEIGSGEVSWIAPYAQKQYYDTADYRDYDPQRGGHWFERMKADHGPAIIAGAKRRAGGGK